MKTFAAAILAVLATVAACSRPQQPKVEVKALDAAKGLQEDLNKKAEDRGSLSDQYSK